ncbi:MAG TPA: glycoside hydrolase family 2 TIM barrel-domain containing protein [Treponemataceae bacterium]|nr:glycoside hydrolase family 2 TIM barrel-domain containing protein [Treponemataceae bacterium]
MTKKINFYENTETQSIHRLAARSNLLPFSSAEKAAEYCVAGPLGRLIDTNADCFSTESGSDYVKTLDGEWNFLLFDNPQHVQTIDFTQIDSNEWNKIKVPGAWARQGYDEVQCTNGQMPHDCIPPKVPENNPVGVYRRTISLSTTWKQRRIVLHIGSAASCTTVLVNGTFVGMSKDSALPCEFDITPYITKDTNEIIIQVAKYSDGSYLEDQSQWWLGGIHRSVYLYSTEHTYIKDVQALTYLKNVNSDDNKKPLGIVPLVVKFGCTQGYEDTPVRIGWKINTLQGSSSCPVLGTLIDEGELEGSCNYAQTSRQIRTQIKIKNPNLWNHERPSLYVLTISMFSDDHHIESTACTFGFKDVCLKNREFCINGKAVLIKGVNRHEHNEHTGKTLTTKQMLRDITLLKQYNFNAVRTSHYPNDERWYELCDRFGILVMDEANIENRAFYDQFTRSTVWTNAYMQRLQRMVMRDKNHACIFCWSLGNESGDGSNHSAMNAWLRRFDTTRLVQYEGAVRGEWAQGEYSQETLARGKGLTDIISPMYPNIELITEYAKKQNDYRPIIMSSFSHAMGNSNGSLSDYWHAIENTHGLHGGFIGNWIEQGFVSSDSESCCKQWKYGKKFGKTPINFDFCLNGLLFPDQTPKPAMEECKKLFAPIKISVLHEKQGVFEVQNCQAFTSLNVFKLKWQLLSNGKKIATGTKNLPAIGAGKKTDVKIPYSEKLAKWYFDCNARLQNPGELVVHIDVVYKKDIHLCKKDSICTWSEFVVEKGFPDSFAAAFSDQNGRVKLKETDMPFETVNLVVAGSKPQLFRAPLENECIKFFRGQEENPLVNFCCANKIATSWITADVQNITEENMHFGADKGQMVLQSDLYTGVNAKERKMIGRFVRRVSSFVAPGKKAGTVWNIEFCLNEELSEYPRVGITAQMNAIYDTVSWYGRGPHECYSDRCAGAALGSYTKKADALEVPYIVPQDNANRCDVRSLVLHPKKGSNLSDGTPAHPLHIEADVPFNFSYSKYTASDLWESTHINELTDLSTMTNGVDGYYILNIDIAQRGVGTGACGPDTLEAYRIRPGVYHIQLRMW